MSFLRAGRLMLPLVCLTPLAAVGLTIIMIGATTVSIIGMGIAAGTFPAIVGGLTAWIAYSRSRVRLLVITPRLQHAR